MSGALTKMVRTVRGTVANPLVPRRFISDAENELKALLKDIGDCSSQVKEAGLVTKDAGQELLNYLRVGISQFKEAGLAAKQGTQELQGAISEIKKAYLLECPADAPGRVKLFYHMKRFNLAYAFGTGFASVGAMVLYVRKEWIEAKEEAMEILSMVYGV